MSQKKDTPPKDSKNTTAENKPADQKTQADTAAKNTEEQQTQPPVNAWITVKRLLTVVVLVFFGWVIVTQVAPRYLAERELYSKEQSALSYDSMKGDKDAKKAAKKLPNVRMKNSPARVGNLSDTAKAPSPETNASLINNGNTDARIAELETQLNSLAKETAEQPVTQRAALEKLESQLASQSEEIATIRQLQQQAVQTLQRSQAFDQLRDAVRSGTPYVLELEKFRHLTAKDERFSRSLEVLGTSAMRGVPIFNQLQRDFDLATQTALTPSVEADAPLWKKMLANIQGVVHIRRIGNVEGESAEALVARAEQQLRTMNLTGATQTLRTLEPGSHAADSFEPWLHIADNYLASRDALSALHSALLESNIDNTPAVTTDGDAV